MRAELEDMPMLLKRFDIPERVAAHRSRLPPIPPIPVVTQSSGTASLFTSPPPAQQGIPLIDVDHTQCRWPLWNTDAPYLVCGMEVQSGKSYCQAHCKRAYVKGHTYPDDYDPSHSNILPKAKPSKAKATTPVAITPKASQGGGRKSVQMSGPFTASSYRGIAYGLLLGTTLTVEALMEATGWTLKLTRETIADLNYRPTHQGRYRVHRDRKAKTVGITVQLDVESLIG